MKMTVNTNYPDGINVLILKTTMGNVNTAIINGTITTKDNNPHEWHLAIKEGYTYDKATITTQTGDILELQPPTLVSGVSKVTGYPNTYQGATNLGATYDRTLTIYLKPPQESNTGKIKVSGSNATIKINGDSVALGTENTLNTGNGNIEITADEGYKLKEITSDIDDGWGESTTFPITNDKSMTISYNLSKNEVQNYFVTTEKIYVPPAPETSTISVNGANITADIDGEQIEINTYNTISSGTGVINIKTVYGYDLKTVFSPDPDGWDNDKYYDITNPSKISIPYDLKKNETLDIYVSVKETQPPSTVAPFNHVYLMNDKNMQQFTKERFTLMLGTSNDPIDTDLSSFIANIIEYPFKISSNHTGNETNIILGRVEMSTRSIELSSDEIEINIGQITVPEKYKNSLDYENTTALLYLPFTESIDIDIHYIINETLTLKYVIDVYSGDTTIIIISSKNNSIIHSEKMRIGRQIPFITNTHNQVLNNSTSGLQNNIYTAYIEIIRNTPKNIDNLITDYGIIKDVMGKGFTTIYDVDLRTHATSEEQSTIKSLLSEGVYIR